MHFSRKGESFLPMAVQVGKELAGPGRPGEVALSRPLVQYHLVPCEAHRIDDNIFTCKSSCNNVVVDKTWLPSVECSAVHMAMGPLACRQRTRGHRI